MRILQLDSADFQKKRDLAVLKYKQMVPYMKKGKHDENSPDN